MEGVDARAARRTPRVLSIAGSDSGGGAGIQADLKAFARCGVHGMTAITALTAQNTVEVRSVLQVAPEMILAQVRCVCEDIGVDAVKVGMLGAVESALAVAQALAELPPEVPVVVDPVMVSESGARLLAPGAERVLIEQVVPLASVLTPNLPEAQVLAGTELAGNELAGTKLAGKDLDGQALARGVLALGPGAVVLTGGHREQALDLFVSQADPVAIEIPGPRYPDGSAHGSGCTHSSVLAAQLALGATPLDAARAARRLAGEAVRDGLWELGRGPGPVDVLGLGRTSRR
jgi:hydroxymethylpyrimidine/phosphomethylpyrimidine kinase